jgi:membrane protein DedA with SNARE-associated domain
VRSRQYEETQNFVKAVCMSLDLISLETIQEIASQYGYWGVFGGILLENLGIPLPGETVTLVGGFLAGNGHLNYWLVLSSATFGAVIGDTGGYWIGRYAGWPFLLRLSRFFRIQEEQLVRVKNKFSQNSAKAVFFGRFIALLRIFAGPLAGAFGMPFRQFFLCNLAGAALWASVIVSTSFFVGRIVPLEALVAGTAQFATLGLLIVAVLIGIPLWLEAREAKKSAQEK